MKRLLFIILAHVALISGYAQELYPVKTPNTPKTFLECLNEYLASANMPAHNHAATDINAGSIADARIPQSAITQHQLALTIAQSQVTSLAADLNLKAPLASPTFTGTPAAPTAAFATNTTQLATTAFVQSSLQTYARVTGSNVTTTGQALADIAGLSVALVANGVYAFEAVLSGSTSNVTTGVQYGVNYSAAGATIEAQIQGSFTSTAAKAERITTLNTATSAFLTTSNQSGAIRIKGIITVGANAGNLTIKHLKVTSGTSTVFINSFLEVKRIL